MHTVEVLHEFPRWELDYRVKAVCFYVGNLRHCFVVKNTLRISVLQPYPANQQLIFDDHHYLLKVSGIGPIKVAHLNGTTGRITLGVDGSVDFRALDISVCYKAEKTDRIVSWARYGF